MKKEDRKGKKSMEKILKKTFTLENTMPASKLRDISQKRLIELIEENQLIGLSVKNEMAITMMGMEEFEELKKYVESLEQIVEEAQLVKELGVDYFETPKEKFKPLPENMSASEYREWRKGLKK